ncbi:hypothetical protein J6590_009939 [Homalodisca vitripennis]|nr:hypothetical protein J6590_009939 [Homalodisca vitripennis]
MDDDGVAFRWKRPCGFRRVHMAPTMTATWNPSVNDEISPIITEVNHDHAILSLWNTECNLKNENSHSFSILGTEVTPREKRPLVGGKGKKGHTLNETRLMVIITEAPLLRQQVHHPQETHQTCNTASNSVFYFMALSTQEHCDAQCIETETASAFSNPHHIG